MSQDLVESYSRHYVICHDRDTLDKAISAALQDERRTEDAHQNPVGPGLVFRRKSLYYIEFSIQRHANRVILRIFLCIQDTHVIAIARRYIYSTGDDQISNDAADKFWDFYTRYVGRFV